MRFLLAGFGGMLVGAACAELDIGSVALIASVLGGGVWFVAGGGPT